MLARVRFAALWIVLMLGLAGCKGSLDDELSALIKGLMLAAFIIAVISLGVAVVVSQSERRLTALAGAALLALLGVVFLFILIA